MIAYLPAPTAPDDPARLRAATVEDLEDFVADHFDGWHDGRPVGVVVQNSEKATYFNCVECGEPLGVIVEEGEK